MSELQTELQQVMQTLQLEDAPAGGSAVVYHQGKLVATANIGSATPDADWQSSTLSMNYSTGKGVLVTLIHVLVSQGLLRFDDAISKYWPEFKGQGKEDIVLKQVLTHQSGLFNIQSITDNAFDTLDWSLMLSRVIDMTPQSPNNKQAQSCYSALVSGWVLGGLIEKVTGMSLNESLERYLAEPLGIKGEIYFGVPKEKLTQVAALVKDFDHFDDKRSIDDGLGKFGNNNSLSKHSNSVSSHINAGQNDGQTNKKRKSRKPKLRHDNQHTLEANQSLPSYDCWQQRTVEDADTDVEGSSDNKAEKPLTTLDIAKLYLDMGNVNIKDFSQALLPVDSDIFDYYTSQALMAKIPAANNVASAQALAKIYAMLANKGNWNGVQLISPEVFEALSNVYVKGSDAIMAAAHPKSMLWRLGYHRVFTRCHSVNNAFGHMGYNGSTAWCDVDRQLAVAFVHNYDITMSTDIRQFAINEVVLSHFN